MKMIWYTVISGLKGVRIDFWHLYHDIFWNCLSSTLLFRLLLLKKLLVHCQTSVSGTYCMVHLFFSIPLSLSLSLSVHHPSSVEWIHTLSSRSTALYSRPGFRCGPPLSTVQSSQALGTALRKSSDLPSGYQGCYTHIIYRTEPRLNTHSLDYSVGM